MRRLDLGADVVAIPSRDLLVIHPDLGYAEALGAVAGTLPDLHPDTVVQLVDQVTPRPQPSRPRRMLAKRAALVAMVVVALVGVVYPETVSASTTFGSVWADQMDRLGMTCRPATTDPGTRVCTDADQHVTEVVSYRHTHSALYVLRKPDGTRTYMRIFDSDAAARDYAESHPESRLAGRVAVW